MPDWSVRDGARRGGGGTPETVCERCPDRAAVVWRPLLVPLLLVVLLVLLLPLLMGNPQDSSGAPPPTADAGARRTPQTAPTSHPTSVPVVLAAHVTRDAKGAWRWPRPRLAERQRERDAMVDSQIARDSFFRGAVENSRVLAAMRAVPRHAFVPLERQALAYDDTPLPIGYGQTISQPFIVALMTELLNVRAGEKVLEIGTGSGYQAAVLNELTPFVYSIEIVAPLAEQAKHRFEQLGYRTIQVREGDGYDGWPAEGPFDAIIVTCAAGHVPPPLWDQLKPGGRMVIPIGGVYETQRLLLLTKQPDGSRSSRNVLPVRFVPMTGRIGQR